MGLVHTLLPKSAGDPGQDSSLLLEGNWIKQATMRHQGILALMAILVFMSPTMHAFPNQNGLSVEQISAAILQAVKPISDAGIETANRTSDLSGRLLMAIKQIPNVLSMESNTLQQVFTGLREASEPHFRKMMVLTEGFQGISAQIAEFEDTCPTKKFNVRHGAGFRENYQIPERVEPKDIKIPVLPSLQESNNDMSSLVGDMSSFVGNAKGLAEAKENTLNQYGVNAFVSLKNLLTAAKVIQARVEQQKRDILAAKLAMHRSAVECFAEVSQHAGNIEENVHELNKLVNAFNVDAMGAASAAVQSIGHDLHRTECVAA